ncbi:MAG: translesion error-prone DNA polymerase V autoproteolytic subunit [Bacteroidota bacterium]|nr:translesion error-prone DNA polymerase V autoproteolytic subunit [uncultured Allomuricauda sp.]
MQVIRTDKFTFYKAKKGNGIAFPFFDVGVSAGFPSPADDFIENRISLEELLVEDAEATYFVRAHGESMVGAGIHDGDVMVVDRSITPKSGHIAICCIDNELTVKRIKKEKDKISLLPENPNFKPIVVDGEMTLMVWGVVTKGVKDFLKNFNHVL